MLRVIAFLTLVLLPTFLRAQHATPDYSQWRSACAKLPSNRELNGQPVDNKLLPLPAFADFDQALDGFLSVTCDGPLAEAGAWIGSSPDPKEFFDTEHSWFGGKEVRFQPFTAKLVVPNDAVLIIMGDLHGDIRSLIATLDELTRQGILDGFKLRDSRHHVLFLGDFTDRGAYGVEVLYTLFRLKTANPDRVHFARGNHEDFNIVSRYGFLAELRAKYGQQADITKLMRAYDRMPVVWYVGNGTDFLQMNHGGMEPGYDPRELLASAGPLRFQLLGELRQKTYHAARPGWLGGDPAVLGLAEKHLRDFIPDSPTKPGVIGFMWNDFTVFADEPALAYERSLVFGARPTQRLLADASTDRVRLRAVVRAHQHSSVLNPLMSRLVASDGAFRHWQPHESTADAGKSVDEIRLGLRAAESRPIPDGSVWTFNVTPDSSYGVACRCNFATVGMLALAPEFAEWRMRVLKIQVFSDDSP